MDTFKPVDIGANLYDTPFLNGAVFAEHNVVTQTTDELKIDTSSVDKIGEKRKPSSFSTPTKKKVGNSVTKKKHSIDTSNLASLSFSDCNTPSNGGRLSRRKDRKNNREKQRRFELNDQFEKLSVILNLGRNAKTEKYQILSEAVNLITALRSENASLKSDKIELRSELNKLTSCLQHAFPGQHFSADPRFQLYQDTDDLTVGKRQGIVPNNFGISQSMSSDAHQFESASVMAVPARLATGGPLNLSSSDQSQHIVQSTPFGSATSTKAPGMQDDFDLFM